MQMLVVSGEEGGSATAFTANASMSGAGQTAQRPQVATSHTFSSAALTLRAPDLAARLF